MGYVPGRKYDGVSGTLDKDGLRVTLPSDMEDSWFFARLWLETNEAASFQRHEIEEGGTLFISAEKISADEEYVFEALSVTITAQGLVMVVSIWNLEDANRLRKAAHYESCGDENVLLCFE
jgi:hypothetical protein